MNNMPLFDSNIFLQQQLLLQQMIIYNQMIYQRTNMLSKTQQQLPKQKNIDENDQSSQQIQKQDETNLIKPLPSKSAKKQSKVAKTMDPQNDENVNKPKKENSQKKKIFLSMLDIKEAQYKKIKIIENDKQKIPISVVQEKW